MPDNFRTRERYGEAFWHKHQETWQQSVLNQQSIAKRTGFRSRRSAIGRRGSKRSRNETNAVAHIKTSKA